MIADKEMIQRLNLLFTSKTFVLKEIGVSGDVEVLCPQSIPDMSGIYWVSGSTLLKAGTKIDSVFRIDTDSSGTLLSIYWRIRDSWYSHDESVVAEMLCMSKESIYPFNWSYNVPLVNDMFH